MKEECLDCFWLGVDWVCESLQGCAYTPLETSHDREVKDTPVKLNIWKVEK